MRLKDKVALITGAGSGIGQATAVLFAREGAKVAVVDLEKTRPRRPPSRSSRAGARRSPIRADVSKSADNQAAIQQAVARWGRLDVFYANAGVPQFPTPVESVDEAVFDQIMAVNVKGVFLGAKHVMPVIKKQKSGVLLITGSTSGIRPRPGVQCYSASKGAVHTMAASLALEFAAVRRARGRDRPGGDRDARCSPTFMGKKQVDEEGMTRYRGDGAARAAQPAGGSRQRGALPRLRRRRDDHRQRVPGGRRPLHLASPPGETGGEGRERADDRHPARAPTRSACARWRRMSSAGRRGCSSTRARRWRPAASTCRRPRRSGRRSSAPTIASRPTRRGPRLIFVSHYHEDHFRHDPGLLRGAARSGPRTRSG